MWFRVQLSLWAWHRVCDPGVHTGIRDLGVVGDWNMDPRSKDKCLEASLVKPPPVLQLTDPCGWKDWCGTACRSSCHAGCCKPHQCLAGPLTRLILKMSHGNSPKAKSSFPHLNPPKSLLLKQITEFSYGNSHRGIKIVVKERRKISSRNYHLKRVCWKNIINITSI